MTTGGSDKPGFGDDLLAELDAWDKTFDALHVDDSLFGAPAAAFDGGDDEVTRTVSPTAPRPGAPAAPRPGAPPATGSDATFDGPTSVVTRAAPAAGRPPVAGPASPSFDDATVVTTAPLSPAAFDAPTTVSARPVDPTVADAPTSVTVRPVAPAVEAVTVITRVPEPSASPRRSAPRTQPPPPPRAPTPVPTPVPSPTPMSARVVDETDFSDLGFSGPPEALGSLLGQPPPLPPIEELGPTSAVASFDDDEVLTSAVRPEALLEAAEPEDDPFAPSAAELDQLRREAHRASPDETRVAGAAPELFEIDETMDRGLTPRRDELSDPGRDPSEDTFDRANRTRILDPDDQLLAEAGAAAKRPPRAGPSIVRRGVPPARKRPESTGGFAGPESTRVADIRELERLAQREDPRQSRPTPATGYQPPPEPVVPDEDFYADIEIGGDDDEVTGTPASARRVTSNVVRRPGDRPSTAMAPAPRPVAVGAIDDEPELALDVGAPAPAEDDLGLDAAIAEFAGHEVTPVGERSPGFARVAPAAPAVELAVDEPIAAEPAVVELAVDEPIADEPVAAEPAVVELAVDEPVADEPVAVELAVDEPPVDEPLADEPAAVELSAEAPTAADSAIAALLHDGVVEAVPEPIAESGAFAGAGSHPVSAASAAAHDALAAVDELVLEAPPEAPAALTLDEALDADGAGLPAIGAEEPDLDVELTAVVDDPPAPPPPVVVANPFADDASGQTKIGVPPPPRALAVPEPVAPVGSAPASAPTPPLAPVAPLPAAAAPVPLSPIAPAVALPAALFASALPRLDLDALALPEQVDPTTGFDPGEAAARGILRLERELETIDDPHQQAVLRVEAGRLYERLGDGERARASYDAALLADPRATAALRGLRRIARGAGDLAEATTHLDVELGVAGPLERRALALHRVDLLMAASEQDLARVAVGELLDTAGGDVRALLAQLELAFLDGRADELDEALDRLGAVIADPALRAAVDTARGHLAERKGDRPRATASFAAAVAADPSALAGHLGALRGDAAAAATSALADRVTEPAVRAALLLEGAAAEPSLLDGAAALAPDDPTVQAAVLGRAMAGTEPPTAELAALAARAVDPALRRAASLWAAHRAPDAAAAAAGYRAALSAEPGDVLAQAALADGHLAAGEFAAAARVWEGRVSAGAGAELDRVRAATLFAAAGDLAAAAALVPSPTEVDSPAAADAWADVLGAVGRPADRAALLAAIAARSDERVEPRLWTGRAAAAADAAATPDDPASIARALAAWGEVIDAGGDPAVALARALVLSASTGDPATIAAAWTRAQAAAESPAAAATLALARARAAAAAGAGWDTVDEIVREVSGDDPRRLAATVALGAAAGQWGDVAAAYEERARAIAARAPIEAALLRFRAAGLYLDRAADPGRAATLLASLADDHPELAFVHDALAAARRRLGDAAPAPRVARQDGSRGDGFARLVRDGEHLASQGDGLGALALLAKALELRPHDPLAAEPLKRVAYAVGEAGPITALALAELRLAEEAGDDRGRADAYEALAAIDRGLRGDDASALISIEAAIAADPSRLAVVRELERAYGAGRWADLAALRERQLAGEPAGPDRIALALDRALVLERLDRPEDELRAVYQGILAEAPRARRPLFHLESLVRRGGASPELVALEDAVAEYFAADPRTQAAFLTRAGETLTDLGRLDDALAHFRAANELRGGYAPALEGWRDAALRGQLWVDFAEAAIKEAGLSDDDATKARLWHLAGVALMDRALAGERAVDALRETLAADPRHLDAFIRLRLLLDEQGEHEALAGLLEARLEVEPDLGEQIGLHRAIAELARNFLEDRERAKRHYRAIVSHSPADLRAIAALSDIAWEQGAWGEAADALQTRARLERDPGVLRNIHFRLGMVYADRLPDPTAAIRAFQRVLAHDPDDEAALERLADLGIATGEWRMALGACERLVKNETVPARKVTHLHRVGRIFAEGFADRRKAERAYQLAVDAAPDSDVALSALIRFYEAAGDAAAIRVHLGMVAAAMRQRASTGSDPTAYRVLARVARARLDAGVAGQGAIHRAAVDLARLAGADAELASVPTPDHLGGLLRAEADELLWPAAVSAGLRQLVALLGDRVAKHVGVDLRPYGVTRGDRVRAKDSPVAAAAQEVAEAFGLGELDVYISSRQPYAMVAEPTSPLSLVIGSAIADGNRLAAVRFAAAGALRLATAHLAILARLPEDELGVLVVALLRLFQPELPYLLVDNDQVGLQLQRLKRLIPSGLLAELRPHALAIDAAAFDHRVLHRGLQHAGHRAGLVAAGGAAAPLAVLLGRAGASDLASGLRDPAVAALVQFAVSEDHAALAALCQA
jgi:hypothetical protein